MNCLPRLRPRRFYDLVIEVALIRPGPIQGKMVHPFLRRRQGKEAITYPHPSLRRILERTLGVPLFQEQGMKIAIAAAGFTASQADELRRAMGHRRSRQRMALLARRLIEGMRRNGISEQAAERIFTQLAAFADFGFAESHAASFALLVYATAWMKHYHPDVYVAAILNAQPMGFYAPAQLVRCARDHDVQVRPVDVNHSGWDATMERVSGGPHRYAVRLGLRQVRGMGEIPAARIMQARANGAFAGMEDLAMRARLEPRTLDALAKADAFGSLAMSRRGARWAARGTQAPLPLFAAHGEFAPAGERAAGQAPALPEMSAPESVWRDYQATSLSLKGHPLQFLRTHYDAKRFMRCADLKTLKDGAWVSVSGLVLVRQRPGDAKVVFITLEDETGIANLIIWPQLQQRYRRAVLTSSLLACRGRMQSESGVIHVIARQLEDHSALLAEMRDGAGALPPVVTGLENPHQTALRKRALRAQLEASMARAGMPPSRDFH
jgi:error-prone DNA polymerase